MTSVRVASAPRLCTLEMSRSASGECAGCGVGSIAGACMRSGYARAARTAAEGSDEQLGDDTVAPLERVQPCEGLRRVKV